MHDWRLRAAESRAMHRQSHVMLEDVPAYNVCVRANEVYLSIWFIPTIHGVMVMSSWDYARL